MLLCALSIDKNYVYTIKILYYLRAARAMGVKEKKKPTDNGCICVSYIYSI